jgi:hypothetical protein
LENLNADEQLQVFDDFLHRVIDTFVPTVTKHNNAHPPWSNDTTRLLVNQKKRAHQRLRKSPTPANIAAFKSARNAVVSGIRQARSAYERDIIVDAKRNPKVLFSYINRKKPCSAANCLKEADGTIILNDKDIATTFNQYFVSTMQPTSLPSPPPHNLVDEVNFNISDIEVALQSLKVDSSAGPDGLTPLFLKSCATTIATPLYLIFSTSVRTCTFPALWKEANITPIHKSGSMHDVKNYRPISLLSVFSKLLERFVHREIMTKCNDLNIFTKAQHGFLPRRSCLTNLLHTYNSLTEHIDNGLACDMVFLDLSKAFDSVSHVKLIEKLYALKFPTPLILWIHSYLYQRRQRVSLRGTCSDWIPVTSGVPQGSVLGPLLFNIFLSDLPHFSSFHCIFADDIKLYSPSFLSETLQQDLSLIENWVSVNSLNLNIDKCAVMHFGHNNPHLSYYLQNKVIYEKSSHSDLGLLVDVSLKFKQHADAAVAKALRKAHCVLKCFTKVDTHLFSILFKTFIRPVLEYASQISRPCYATALARLEKCQRRLTKWCTSIRNKPYDERLRLLNLPLIEKRFNRGDLILVYKILNNLVDVAPSDFFCPANTNTRGHSLRLVGTSTNLNIRHRFFTERVIPHWNKLPQDIVSAPTLNTFKARLDRFLP